MIVSSRNGWIGIDVGAKTLKLAQLTRRGGQLALAASASVNRTSSGSVTEAIRNDLETALAIAGELHGKRTAATLPIDSCRLEPGRPPKPDAGAEEESGWSYASWPTGDESQDPDAGWYTISTRAENADSIADGLLQSGLSCRLIDGAPMALARAVGMVAPNAHGACMAAIDWGERSARLVSVVSGYPIYVRTMKGCGLHTAVDLVAEELGVTTAEAADALHRRRPPAPESSGHDDPVAQQLGALIRPVFERLLSEIRRTLSHLRSHRKNAIPESLYLVGGGATMPGVADWLASKTQLPTEVWRPPGADASSQDWSTLAPAIALSALAWGGR